MRVIRSPSFCYAIISIIGKCPLTTGIHSNGPWTLPFREDKPEAEFKRTRPVTSIGFAEVPVPFLSKGEKCNFLNLTNSNFAKGISYGNLLSPLILRETHLNFCLPKNTGVRLSFMAIWKVPTDDKERMLVGF